MSEKIKIYDHDEEINAKILAISEDLVKGFHLLPFHYIAKESGIPIAKVIERIKLMLKHGVIRRIRQTIMTNKIVDGALVAWKIGSLSEKRADKDNQISTKIANSQKFNLNEAFDFMSKKDPFSGHVVIRSTDRQTLGSDYHLWTTVKVPIGESVNDHCNKLKKICGAEDFIIMPAKGIFTLGVGHVRRKKLRPGERHEKTAKMITSKKIDLTKEQWKVLLTLKRELSVEEICENPWESRAKELNISLNELEKYAKDFEKKGILGRFSTFLEHVKPSKSGKKVTKYNGLFHWRVPKGMEERAGCEVGRYFIITHCYWREGGSDFGDVNIMAVAHGSKKDVVLEHKRAIDEGLKKEEIKFDYTNVFWGGRSEIKPSEISPEIYKKWHKQYT